MFRSILSALTLLFFSPLSAQFQPDIEKKIDSIMMHTYPLTDPGAVLLIAKNGVPVMEKGYGLANIELTVANKPEFVFAIGSMSKQFTAVCLLQLQDAGKLSLDDDIRKHLPHYDTHGETITIRHLLTHTSGIPSFTELDTFQHLINTDNSIADISNLFMNRPLLFSPGSNWSYSNSGYLLAGMIVEKVSGVTLETYLRQHIFLPLGMNSTSMGSNDRVIPRMVTGYDMGSYGYMPTREYSWIWTFGAGGIVSNTSDLLKWDEALYQDKLLSDAAKQEAFSPYQMTGGQSTNYGMGWDVRTYKDYPFISHGGAIGGFLSEAVRIPSEHLYITILSNNTTRSPGQAMDKIINLLFDLGIEDVVEFRESDDLEAYTGVYQIDRTGGRLVSNYSNDTFYRYITADSTDLYCQITGGAKIKLIRIAQDEFTNGDPYTRFKFTRNEDGVITSVKIENLPTGYGPDEVSVKTELPLPAAKKNMVPDPKILQRYVGKYDFGGGFLIEVSALESRLFIQATGQSKFEVYAESDTQFYLTIVDASIEFIVDDTGQTTSMILHQGGDYPGNKIE